MKIIKVLVLLTILILNTNLNFAQVLQNYWDEIKNLSEKDTSIETQDNQINKKREALNKEINRLEPIAKIMKSLDPLYLNVATQWLVKDKNIQLNILNKIREKFEITDSKVFTKLLNKVLSDEYEIRVIQRPMKDSTETEADCEIIALYVGNKYALIGEVEIRKAISDDLYELLQNRKAYRTSDVSNIIIQNRYFSNTEASLYGGKLLIFLRSQNTATRAGELPEANDPICIGAKVDIGYDILNYPFWYGSIWNISAYYAPNKDQHYSVGSIIPFRPGEKAVNLIGPLTLNSRKLNGTYGLSSEFGIKLFEIESLTLPFIKKSSSFPVYFNGNMSYSSLKDKGNEILIDGNSHKIDQNPPGSLNNFYFVGAHAIGYFGFELPDLLRGIRLDLGYGFFRVNNSIVDPIDGTSIKDLQKNTITDMYAKIFYRNEGVTKYEVSLQYFNQSLMFIGNLELFPWLSIEAKYSRMVNRSPEMWEYNDYFVISPKVTLKF